MSQQPTSPAERLAVEHERERCALSARLRDAGRRPPEENLAAGLALIRTAEEFRAAFAESARR